MRKRVNAFAARLSAACLQEIAAQKEGAFSWARVARRLRVSQRTLQKTLPNLEALPAFLIAAMDARVATALGPRGSATPHERLFDFLLTRLEFLQEERAGALRFARLCRRTPLFFRSVVQSHRASAVRIAADVWKQRTPPRFLSLIVLGLLESALLTWERDQTPDLSSSMAALDKKLHLIVPYLNRFYSQTADMNPKRAC